MRSYLGSVLAVVLFILVAGAAGFDATEAGSNPGIHNFGDALWWALVTMTTVGYGDIFPVTLFGRLIGAVLMVTGIGTLGISTAAIAAYLIRSDRLDALRIRGMEGHVVVCGLGAAGALLAQAFRAQGRQVLVIEKDDTNPRIVACRDAGIAVLIGDAARPETLRRARLDRAREMLVVCGSDGENMQVTAQANALRQVHPERLTCATQINDPELWYALRTWELSESHGVRQEFFNLSELGARALLALHPPFAGRSVGAKRPTGAGAQKILLVGAGPIGQYLIQHMVRQRQDDAEAHKPPLQIVLVDRHPEPAHDQMHYRHPELRTLAEVTALAMDLRSSEFQRGAFLFDGHGHCVIAHAYVCLDDDGLALSTALLLVNHLRRFGVPVTVQMPQEGGLASLLNAARSSSDRSSGQLQVFSLLEQACKPELVLGGTNEVLARALHQDYLESAGDKTDSDAAVAWEDLSAEMQEANRNEANHIAIKLKAAGLHLVPLTALEAEPFSFTPDEVEQLAMLEHDRWVKERTALGWTPGPRNAENKTNPNLVPWSELPEASREMNRASVRQLPTFLMRTGFTARKSG